MKPKIRIKTDRDSSEYLMPSSFLTEHLEHNLSRFSMRNDLNIVAKDRSSHAVVAS
jgi:hypothetical protein